MGHFALMQTLPTFIGEGKCPFIQTLLNNGAFFWLAHQIDFPCVLSLLANAAVINPEQVAVRGIVQTFC